MYKLFLAWRYLTRRILTVLAMLALGLSFWALTIAPSVMNGFQAEFHKRIRGTLSDLTLTSGRPFEMPERPEIQRALERVPSVKAVAPYLENPALDKHLNKIDYCFLRGVDPEREARVARFADYLLSERELYEELEEPDRQTDPELKAQMQEVARSLPPEPDLPTIYRRLNEGHEDYPGLPTCLVGIYYLRNLSLRVGDTILLTTASDKGQVAEDREFLIVGAFRTGISEKDRRVIITGLRTLQDFVGVPGRVTGYSMALTDYALAQETEEEVRKRIQLGEIDLFGLDRFYLLTWEEHNENLLRAVGMEKLLIRLMMFIVVLMASVAVLFVMFIIVQTKVREFGILRALGGTPPGVLLLFVGQGMIIAMVGALMGLGAGILTSNYINEIADLLHAWTGWHPFPPDIYYLDRIPTRIDQGENLVNFAVTLGFGALAGLVPGISAAFRPPLRALRHD